MATIINAGSVWKYLDDGSDPGAAWNRTNFDDTEWSWGPARLGYGVGDEATVVGFGPDAHDEHITTYFRHVFWLDHASSYDRVVLRILCADGAVVHLNGAEVFRSNMPAGAIGPATTASAPVDSGDSTFLVTSIPPAHLSDGVNAVAVEIHRHSRKVSAISFDLELRAHVPRPAGVTRFAVIGDFGAAGEAAGAVADLVKSWDPEFIVTLGDNNYPTGEAITIDDNIGQFYHEFIGNYQGAYGGGPAPTRRSNFYPSLGNHDWMPLLGLPPVNSAQPYLDYFTLPDGGGSSSGNERYYNFTRGNVEFFCVDSDDHEPDGLDAGSIQYNWLRDQLALSSARWKLVFMHHAPYSSGGHGSSDVMRWPYHKWGATAVLAGHNHLYERIIDPSNCLPYFVNGLGGTTNFYAFYDPLPGSKCRFTGVNGAMLIEASAFRLRFEFIRVDQASESTPYDRYSVYPWTGWLCALRRAFERFLELFPF